MVFSIAATLLSIYAVVAWTVMLACRHHQEDEDHTACLQYRQLCRPAGAIKRMENHTVYFLGGLIGSYLPEPMKPEAYLWFEVWFL